MVEDWPLHRIREAIQAQGLETLRPQEGDRTYFRPRQGIDRETNPTGHGRPVFLLGLAACGLAVLLAMGIIGGL